MKQKVIRMAGILIASYLLLVGGLYLMQRSMIYFPSQNISDITPLTTQGVFELEVQTKDGINLKGWMQNPEEDKKIIVFFYGNASDFINTYYKAQPYIQQGYGFLLAGYRGYEGNAGKPSEQGFYQDARAWINKLEALGISQNNIILYGESIGTGVAVQMATEFLNVHAVILESPYISLPDVAAKTYFFIPVRLLMKDRFDNLSKIKQVRAPLLILQGLNDKIIPPAFGQKLYDHANEPKEIIKFEGYGHNDMSDVLKSEAVLKFLAEKSKPERR